MRKPIDTKTVGGRIRMAKEKCGLKTKELAESAGISANHACLIESGRRNPSNELLDKIAEITHVSYEWLKTGEGQQRAYNRQAGSRLVSVGAPVSVPNTQLMLMLLKWQKPQLFPAAVTTMLDITPETLDKLLEGSAEYEPRWHHAFSLLAQRMDRGALREAFRSLDEFLAATQTPDALQKLHTALRSYLYNKPGEYKLTKEQPRAEQYRLCDGMKVQIHVLSFSKRTRHGDSLWHFKYVDTEPLTDFGQSADLDCEQREMSEEIRNSIKGIVFEQLSYLSEKPLDRVTLVVSDVGLYDRFYDCTKDLRFEAEENGRAITADTPQLSLMLFDESENRIEDVTPFYDYD